MKLIRQLIGVYLVLVGLAVAIHFVATQFYDPTITGDSLDVWLVLDVLMAIALVIILATAIRRKQMLPDADSDGRVTREYLEANFSFYFGASLLLIFLWNWAGFAIADPRSDNGTIWALIDATLPLFVGQAGIRLLLAKSPPWAQD